MSEIAQTLAEINLRLRAFFRHPLRPKKQKTYLLDYQRQFALDISLKPATKLTDTYRDDLPPLKDGKITQPTNAFNRSAPRKRTETVDIIVCVHNALDDTKICLESIRAHTQAPYRLIVVNDGSGEDTSRFLEQFCQTNGATLIRHERALGYTFAANAGLRAVESPYCVLLNSDTQVFAEWVDRLIDPFRTNSNLAVVGPLSNAASWQSTPELIQNEDWHTNNHAYGLDPEQIADLATKEASAFPIPTGFVNGFCYCIRTSALREVGLFDEVNFAAGYGEENDLSIRFRKAGFELAVVDTVYILHRHSRSYGNKRRQELCARADAALSAKHSAAEFIEPFVKGAKNNVRLAFARAMTRANIHREQLLRQTGDKFRGRKVAFYLPVEGQSGGANVILHEAEAMLAFGVETTIVNLQENRTTFEAQYSKKDVRKVYINDHAELAEIEKQYDAIIATNWQSFSDVATLSGYGCAKGYYIQDDESKFNDAFSKTHTAALRTYRKNREILRFTKTQWNSDAIRAHGGITPHVIGPSVDLRRCRPLGDTGSLANSKVRITAMIRLSTPHRNPIMTGHILSALAAKYGDRVTASCFGSATDELIKRKIRLNGVTNYGKLSVEDAAIILGQTDIFLDLSNWQAMGLTAMEAMACGAVVVVPEFGGAKEVSIHGISGFHVDTTNPEQCLRAVDTLIMNDDLRSEMRVNAIEDVSFFAPENAALEILKILFLK